jgi:hypothetical protein
MSATPERLQRIRITAASAVIAPKRRLEMPKPTLPNEPPMLPGAWITFRLFAAAKGITLERARQLLADASETAATSLFAAVTPRPLDPVTGRPLSMDPVSCMRTWECIVQALESDAPPTEGVTQ